MNNETILKKAIEKAQKNGYDFDKIQPNIDKVDWIFVVNNEDYRSIIFSHDFAKAFWGEMRRVGSICGKDEPENGKCCDDYDCRGEWVDIDWQGALQQMVLEEEPLKYIKRYL